MVEPLFRKYETLCPAWLNRLRLTYIETLEVPAEIHVHDEYRAADLRIGPTFLNLWGNRDHCIVHELMHLYTCPMMRVSREVVNAMFKDDDPAYKVVNETLIRAMEAANEDLTLMALKLTS